MCLSIGNALSEKLEINNGLLGVLRDIFMRLLKLMYMDDNDISKVRNMIGLGKETVEWMQHRYFSFTRTALINLRRLLIQNPHVDNMVRITPQIIYFTTQQTLKAKAMFFRLSIKNMILECHIKIINISKEENSYSCVGLTVPSKLDKAMQSFLGYGTGCLCLGPVPFIFCNSNYSLHLSHETLSKGGSKAGDVVVGIVNNHNNNSKGKMHFLINNNLLPYCIGDIPSNGVHLGVYNFNSVCSFHFFLLKKLRTPPLILSSFKCICFNFDGKFDSFSYNLKNEDGMEIPDIMNYFIHY